jgi:NAD(P)-dependent dehydrogenase (short-subunit alcohol dehydrogenase family)
MTKTAFVTGGARGIGFGVSRCLAQEGWNLAVLGRRDEESARDALDELRATGADVVYCRGDVSSAAERLAALDRAEKALGPIHALVNNAGVAPKVRADILDATEESFEWVMKINLQGPYFLTQAVARRMIAARERDPEFVGAIVNVSSISATVASPSRGEYCISKAGVSMATRLWATRLAEYGISVFEVRPGITLTDMTSVVKEKYDRLLEEGLCLQARWGFPEDVGKAVAMLVRGDLGYSTGQVIMVDGGLTMPRL